MGLGAFGISCCCGSVFFVTDNTGSMGGTITTLKPGFKQLVDDINAKFAVASYQDVPISDPIIFIECSTDKSAVKAALDEYVAAGGGDADENFTQAVTNIALSWGDFGCGGGGVIVLTGDAKSHTDVYTVAEAIDACVSNNIKVLALNTAGSGSGLDGASQATNLCAATGGTLINNVLSVPYADVYQALKDLL